MALISSTSWQTLRLKKLLMPEILEAMTFEERESILGGLI